MAQALDPNTVFVAHLATRIDTHQFRTGFVEGLTGQTTRFSIALPATEAGVVEIVRNMTELAQEGNLTENMLRRDCGLLAGWISRQAFREERLDS